ncbi:MAG: response regulator [Eubacteriales bacterium]|nr:response regulator [Eubacteriales bacterium]
MKAILVDDEQIALDNLKITLEEFQEITEINCFRTAAKTLDWLGENSADIAFLDINMKKMDGLVLAKKLKELCPACAVIFVTGYSEYALQAIQMHASGYLLKPVSKESVRKELDYILSMKRDVSGHKRIQVQCFGNFEVFTDGMPMKFQYSKTKELLAYLVDRKGAYCTNGELMGILWEEKSDKVKKYSYFRDLRSDLLKAFSAAGCADAIQKQRGMIAVVPEKIDCDYYDWLEGKIEAVNRYEGEYMAQYSWGELTLGIIKMS